MITVHTTDYNPLYRANEAQTGAAKAGLLPQQLALEDRARALQKSENNRQLVTGIVDSITQIAGQLYNVYKNSQMEKAKADVFSLQSQANQQTYDAIMNNQFDFVDSGNPDMKTLKLTNGFDEWVKQSEADLETRYGNIPEVRAWAKDQLYGIATSSKVQAMQYATQKLTKDGWTDFTDRAIPAAMKQAVATRNPSALIAAWDGFGLASPQERATGKAKSLEDFQAAIDDVNTRSDVTTRGLSPVLTSIDAKEASGAWDAGTAEAHRKTAVAAAQQASLMWQDKAWSMLQTTLNTPGADPEKAIAEISAKVPESYRADVQKNLTAQWKIQRDETDRKADEETADFYYKNPDNPVDLRKHLLDPKNNLSQRFNRDTQMYWLSVADQEISAAARGDKAKPVSDQGTMNLMWDYYFSSTMPDDQFASLLRQNRLSKDGTILIQPDDATGFLSKMASREKIRDPRITAQVDLIKQFFDEKRGAVKNDPAKVASIDREQTGVMNALTNELTREGGTHLDTLDKIVQGMLAGKIPQKLTDAMVPKFDPMRSTPDADSKAAPVLLLAQNREITRNFNPDTFTSLEGFSREFLKRMYGIPGEEINLAGFDEDPDGGTGLPIFILPGTDKDSDGKPVMHAVQVRTDPETNRIGWYEWNGGPSGSAKNRGEGGDWVPATHLENRAATGAVAEHAKAVADIEKGNVAHPEGAPAAGVPLKDIEKKDPNEKAFYTDIYAKARARVKEEAYDLKAVYAGISPTKVYRAPTDREKARIAKELAAELLQKWKDAGGSWTKMDEEDAADNLLRNAFTETN